MTRCTIMAVIVAILILGGCQNNGTAESDKKLPEPEQPNFSTTPIYDPQNSKLIGYSIGEVAPYVEVGGGSSIGTFPGERLVLFHNYDRYSENNDFDDFKVWAYGAITDSNENFSDFSFKALPSGTVAYGRTPETRGLSSFVIRHGDSFFDGAGIVSIEVNFDEGKITKLDGYTFDRYDDTLEKYSYEHAVHLADSNQISIDKSTGAFSGNASLVEQKFLNGGLLEVQGTFHGGATDTGISGLFYNNQTKGGFAALKSK